MPTIYRHLQPWNGMTVMPITMGKGGGSNRLAFPCEWLSITYLSARYVSTPKSQEPNGMETMERPLNAYTV